MKKIWGMLLLLFFLCSLAGAVSNQTITFQGRLIDSLGSPVNGSKKMMFKIWNQPTGGTSIPVASLEFLNNKSGQPIHTVICNDGNYAAEILLDPEQTGQLNAFTNAYLEVYVGDSEEVLPSDVMSPRIHLTASSYALTSKQIDGLFIQRGDESVPTTNDGVDVDVNFFY